MKRNEFREDQGNAFDLSTESMVKNKRLVVK